MMNVESKISLISQLVYIHYQQMFIIQLANQRYFFRFKIENKVNIYDLLPEEISEAIKRLSNALDIVQNRKNIKSRFISNEKQTVICPNCNSEEIIKNGHNKNKVQIYKCKNCEKAFTSCTNTFMSYTKLSYEKLVIFFECMNNKLSIRKTAAKMEVNKNTVFLLRHKVLDTLSEIKKY